jgi:hypothetical protein
MSLELSHQHVEQLPAFGINRKQTVLCVYWAPVDPHVHVGKEVNPPGVNVWCGLTFGACSTNSAVEVSKLSRSISVKVQSNPAEVTITNPTVRVYESTPNISSYPFQSIVYRSAVQRSYVLGHNSLVPMEVRAPPH